MPSSPGSIDSLRLPPAIPLPLLITGISGVAGYNIWQVLRQAYGEQVWGLRQTNNRQLHRPGIIACDIEDLQALRRVFATHGFAAVLDCGGNCALRACELDRAMAFRINYESVENLLRVLQEFPARLVRFSIDLVFAGRAGGGYCEGDPPDPVTVYGQSMAAGESLVLAEAPEACVARISLPMGPSPNHHAGAIDWIQSRFRKNKPATLYYDEIRTPTYTDCLSRVAAELLCAEVSGLIHTGGPRALSLYQIAQIVNRVGGYAPHLLQGCFRTEAGPTPPRAGNVSLHSGLLESRWPAPFLPWPFDAALVPTHHDWHWERHGWPGSLAQLKQLLYRPVPLTIP